MHLSVYTILLLFNLQQVIAQTTDNPKAKFIWNKNIYTCKGLLKFTQTFQHEHICPVDESSIDAADVCPNTCEDAIPNPPTITKCFKKECNKRATKLEFKVSNRSCNDSNNDQGDKSSCTEGGDTIKFPAYVVVTSKKEKGKTYVSEFVKEGGIIVIQDNGNELPSDMTITIQEKKDGGKIYQINHFHSSCSKDLYLTDTFGCVKLVSFTNEDGTFDCLPKSCTDPDIPQCNKCTDGEQFQTNIDIEEEPTRNRFLSEGTSNPISLSCSELAALDPCHIQRICEEDLGSVELDPAKQVCFDTCFTCPRFCSNEPITCADTPTRMKLSIIGGSCAKSDNDQEQRDGEFVCTDEVTPIQFPLHVTIESKKVTYYTDTVQHKGDVITIGNGEEEIASPLMVTISDLSHTIYQEFEFDASCSNPEQSLNVNDFFGGIKIISFTNDIQGTKECPVPPIKEIPCRVPTEFPSVSPTTSPPVTIPDSCDDSCPDFTQSLEKIEFWEGCCTIENENDRPPKNCCCSLPGAYKPDYCCEECDPYTDERCPFECPPERCEKRPEQFYFHFSGGSCNSSRNSQIESGKFECEDLSTIDASKAYYLIFKDGKNSNGEVYYEGWVNVGKTVTLTHNGKFQSDMIVEVYADAKKKWLQQSLKYHSSCSKNLFTGDVFGAVTLVGFKSEVQLSKCKAMDTCAPCEPTLCKRRMNKKFWFKLTGGSCAKSNNIQDKKFQCEEFGPYNPFEGKYVRFTDVVGSETYFEGFVDPDQVMKLTPPSDIFPDDMVVRIYTDRNEEFLLQDIQLSSSCQRNLRNGDSFGAVTVVGFQGARCF